jgi:hypothetical protein
MDKEIKRYDDVIEKLVDTPEDRFFQAVSIAQKAYGVSVVDYVTEILPKTHKRYIPRVAKGISHRLNNREDVFTINIDKRTTVDREILKKLYPSGKVKLKLYHAMLKDTAEEK